MTEQLDSVRTDCSGGSNEAAMPTNFCLAKLKSTLAESFIN
jgi:hypothetical protein